MVKKPVAWQQVMQYRGMTNDVMISRLNSWSVWREYLGARYNNHVLELDEHGACRHCKGTGVIRDPKRGYMRCICEIKRQEELILPNQEYRTLFQKPKEWEIRGEGDTRATLVDITNKVDEWIKWPGKWLFLWGWTGTGKTHLLTKIADELYPWALYLSVPDMADYIFLHRTDDELSIMIEALKRHPILIFDDWGAEYNAQGKEFVRSTLRSIVDFRCKMPAEYPVLSSTNMQMSAFSAYDPRLASRLLDTENSILLSFENVPDWRLTK